MSTYLSIKQAARRFNKSDKTIRRLVKQLTDNATGDDRRHIKPGPEELTRLTEEHKKIKYTISTDLLRQAYGEPVPVKKTKPQPGDQPQQGTPPTPTNPIVQLYEARISDLKEQLEAKDKIIRNQADERKQLRRDTKEDKEQLANLATNLSQFMLQLKPSNPPPAAATEQDKQPPPSSVTNTDVVDTTPKPTPVTRTPKSRSTTKKQSQSKKSPPRKTPARQSFGGRFRRFLSRGK